MSGYLDHLPAVLRSRDLGDLLMIFEKMLDGIDDGVATPATPLARLIDTLPDLYDPARTRQEFLPWLAGWLGFELPTGWSVAQQRRVVAGIMGLHLLRGTRQGLAELLGLAAPVAERQRITVDSGAKVLFARPIPDGQARVHALLSQGPYIRPAPNRTLAYSGLVSPQCLALTPDGDLVVGDAGGIGGKPAPGVWRITRTGAYADQTGGPPVPRPLGSAGWNLTAPVAVAIDPTPPGWKLYVLDVQQTGLRLSRITTANLFQEETVQVHASVRNVVDVTGAVFDRGHLLILNRRDKRIVDIDLASPAAEPRTIPLPGLTAPRSLMVDSDDRLIVGDTRPETPAELFRVDLTGAAAPAPLLAAVLAAGNPLLAPYAVIREDARVLLVLDVGLQPDQDPARPYLRRTLRPATLYRIDLRVNPPRVTLAGEPGALVFPRGMVRHEGTVYLCDGGEPLSRNETGPNGVPRRNLRASANELAVIVHFVRTGATVGDQRAALRSIGDALDRERSAAALPTLLSAIGTD
ncbi:phage tail protein [Acrocarpospora catenulata]|uniref:phage tail protein n=1 Tax=Acrocarpospora catenulata TaxID=2836182 RepID=UPI001BD945D2|nr:phage tail protein [Acrocarpospora catenulata]